jgi:Sec-independent protein translocase protein TatA
MELLLIAVVIAIVAGPTAIPKVIKAAQSLQRARSKLTPQALVDHLAGEKEPKKKKKRPRRDG